MNDKDNTSTQLGTQNNYTEEDWFTMNPYNDTIQMPNEKLKVVKIKEEL